MGEQHDGNWKETESTSLSIQLKRRRQQQQQTKEKEVSDTQPPLKKSAPSSAVTPQQQRTKSVISSFPKRDNISTTAITTTTTPAVEEVTESVKLPCKTRKIVERVSAQKGLLDTPPQKGVDEYHPHHQPQHATSEEKNAIIKLQWPLHSEDASPLGYPEGALKKALDAISRKRPKSSRTPGTDVDFQVLDSDYVTMRPPSMEVGEHLRPLWIEELFGKGYCGSSRQSSSNSNGPWKGGWGVSPRQQKGPDIRIPVIRITGVTLDGTTVHVRVHAFEPYIFVCLPPGNPFGELEEGTQMHDVRIRLDAAIGAARLRSGRGKKRADNNDDAGARIVRVIFTRKIPIRGYILEPVPFLRIWTSIPEHVTHLRQVLEEPNSLWDGAPSLKTYEADILFPLRFSIDHGITGSSWVRVIASHPGTRIAETPAGSGPLDHSFESGGLCAREARRWLISRELDETEYPGMDRDAPRWTDPNDNPEASSRCHINVFAHSDAVTSLGTNGQWAVHAPLLMMSIDTEWLGRRGAFPRKGKDPIITACMSVAAVGSNEPKVTVAFQLGDCLPCSGNVPTVWFKDEASLLMAVRDAQVAADVDIETGYNINNFDEPYMDERAREAGILDKFSDRGRFPTADGKERINRGGGGFTSKAQGSLKIEDVIIPGRLMHDMCIVYKREQDKLSSYSLNSVAQHYLGRQKMDVSHQEIPTLATESAISRKRLAEYCNEDTRLPISLATARKIIEGHVEMSRCTGVPLSFLLTRGQQVKVHAKLLIECRKHNIVVDTAARRVGVKKDMESKYAGAVVLTPSIGYHDVPIPTLDFFSLYPTIILGHNLCYTTCLTEEQAMSLHPGNVFTLPSGDKFVMAPQLFEVAALEKLGLRKGEQFVLFPDGKGYFLSNAVIPKAAVDTLKLTPERDFKLIEGDSENVKIDGEKRHGILPRIVRELLTARNMAKAEMGTAFKAGNKALGEIYNQRQLSLKLVANSVYGFTGAQNGKLPASAIAGGVTAVGRGMIEFTKYTVESTFEGSKVLYGDTDSVMIDFGIDRPTDEVVSNACMDAIPSHVMEKISMYCKESGEVKKILDSVTVGARAAIAVRVSRLPHIPPKDKTRFLRRIREVCAIVMEETCEAIKQAVSTARKMGNAEAAAVVISEGEKWYCKLSEAIRKAGKLPAIRAVSILAKKASELVTASLCYPKKLEFEKVLFPWLSVSRKRYCGCKIIGDKEDDEPLAMGIETRRRDNCAIVRNTMTKVIDMIMKHGNLKGAIEFVKNVVDSVYARDVPLDMLIITSGYSKKEAFYGTKQKHIEVIKKMHQRGQSIVLGDRVAYVIVDGPKKAKNYEKAEEAMYALEHNLPIDPTYYIDHQLKKPVGRIMKALIKDPEKIFAHNTSIEEILESAMNQEMDRPEKSSAHPRMVSKKKKKCVAAITNMIKASSAPSEVSGIIDGHAEKVSESCLSCGCGIPVVAGEKAPPTCENCQGETAKTYLYIIAKSNSIERKYTGVLSHCYRCSESISSEGVCKNDLCPFTYLKTKLARDMEDISGILERFK